MTRLIAGGPGWRFTSRPGIAADIALCLSLVLLPATAASQIVASTAYVVGCAGKAECTPGDMLEVKAAGNGSPPAVTSVQLTVVSTRKCPQPRASTPAILVGGSSFAPLSLPLLPRLADLASGPARQALMCASGGKAILEVQLQTATGNTTSEVGLDLAPLWTGGMLELRVDSARCEQPCRFDSDVTLEVAGLASWRSIAGNDTDKLVLSLDGVRLPGLVSRNVAGKDGNAAVVFQLQRLDKPDNLAAWTRLRQAALKSSPQQMAIGLSDTKGPLSIGGGSAGTDHRLIFDVLSPEKRLGVLLLFLFFIATVVSAVGQRNAWALLRDRFDIPEGLVKPEQRSFSLGRCQMLLWTVVVLLAWLNGIVSVGDWFTVNETALSLMGIGAATAVAAAVATPPKVTQLIQDYKAATVGTAARQDAEAAIQTDRAIVTQGFWKDLLSDDGVDNGLHRLQLLFFTPLVATIFLWSAFWEGSMPTLPGTTLALLGISSAGYVGFKMAP